MGTVWLLAVGRWWVVVRMGFDSDTPKGSADHYSIYSYFPQRRPDSQVITIVASMCF